MFLLCNGAETLPDERLDLGSGDSPPPRFLEAAIRLPVELDDIEALRKLPFISGRVVDPTIGVVLDDDWR